MLHFVVRADVDWPKCWQPCLMLAKISISLVSTPIDEVERVLGGHGCDQRRAQGR